MKRLIIIFSSILVAAGAMAFAFTYYQQSKTNVVAASSIVHVDLLGDHAEPSVVSVGKGKYVQFNTKDDKIHDIGQGSGDSTSHHSDPTTHDHPEGNENSPHDHAKSDTHEHTEGVKESGSFGKGQSYRVQFNEKGTFTFHDHLNPEISIVVVVYESGNK